jgi:ribosomal-protein-serine acetyltransferase
LLAVVAEAVDHLSPWMPWAPGYSRASQAEFLAGATRDWAAGVAYNYLITTGGAVVGATGLMARIGPGGLEIGYWVHPDYAGRGITTAAAGALAEAAFGLPGTDRVEIIHDLNNAASGQIPRKLGFARVATVAGGSPRAAADSGTRVIWRLVHAPAG